MALAVTTLTDAPSGHSGSITFPVADASRLAVNDLALVYPQTASRAPVTMASQAVSVLISGISGAIVTATVISNPLSRAMGFGEVVDASFSHSGGGPPVNIGSGTEPTTFADASLLNVRDHSNADPITDLHVTAQMSRVEHITVPPVDLNVSDPKYNSLLRLSVRSADGNIMQANALSVYVNGFSQTGNYNTGSLWDIRHSAGVQGGSMGLFVGSRSSKTGDATNSIIGIGFAVANDTGADVASSSFRNAMLDLVVDSTSAHVFGSAFQMRALGAGVNSIFIGSGIVTGAGFDFSPISFSDPTKILQFDSGFQTGFSGGFPLLTFDANDYIWYVRSGAGAGAGVWTFHIGTDYLMEVGNWTPAANQTALYLAEGATPTLRQVQWKAGNTLGAGDKVLVLV